MGHPPITGPKPTKDTSRTHVAAKSQQIAVHSSPRDVKFFSAGSAFLKPSISSRQSTEILQRSLGNQAVLHLLSHASPVPQTKLTISQPGDLYEQEADRVAEQVMRMPEPGTTTSVAIAQRAAVGSIQRQPSMCGPTPCLTDDEIYADYRHSEERIEEQRIAEFSAKIYSGRYESHTGYFFAAYFPKASQLLINVPISLSFEDSIRNWITVQDPTGPKPQLVQHEEQENWTPKEKEDWSKDFKHLVETTWSNKITIYSSRPGWYAVAAKVQVVADLESNDDRAFQVQVFRGDLPDRYEGRSVVKPGHKAVLDFEDTKGGAAAHEFGHMLGLGDEYQEKGKPDFASHSDLVEEEFGYKVPRLDERQDRFKESIMFHSTGGQVLTEHGVIFLDALRKITRIWEWTLKGRP